MDSLSLPLKISRQYEEGNPFVIYSEIGENHIKGLFQSGPRTGKPLEWEEDGFILFPFDKDQRSFFIPKTSSEEICVALSQTPSIERKEFGVSERQQEKEDYLERINKTIATIKKGVAQKIVMSRVKEFPLSGFSWEILIDRLFSLYPTAFRYIWFHPQTGIWCGATPEILMKVKETQFKTMALAGTQPFNEGEIKWGIKEQEEQHFVTEAILGNIKNQVQHIKVSDTYSHRAGSLLHLRTDISGILKPRTGALREIAFALHPTPAVGGSPKEFSTKYIIHNDGYDREFYTGFLGWVNEGGASATFMVNLRCMKIDRNKAYVYVGGGITKDSVAEREWEETQNKMQTMLQVLAPML